MNTHDKDNILKIMTVLLSVMFFLIAFKVAYADSIDVSHNEDYISFWLNVVWIFALYEVPFILSVYVAGPMISDAIRTNGRRRYRSTTRIRLKKQVRISN